MYEHIIDPIFIHYSAFAIKVCIAEQIQTECWWILKTINRQFQQFYQRQLASLMANTTPFQKNFFQQLLYSICMCMRECRSFNSESNICRPRWGEEVGRKLCKMYQARIQHFSSQPTKNRTTNKISYLINCWWCWSSLIQERTVMHEWWYSNLFH